MIHSVWFGSMAMRARLADSLSSIESVRGGEKVEKDDGTGVAHLSVRSAAKGGMIISLMELTGILTGGEVSEDELIGLECSRLVREAGIGRRSRVWSSRWKRVRGRRVCMERRKATRGS